MNSDNKCEVECGVERIKTNLCATHIEGINTTPPTKIRENFTINPPSNCFNLHIYSIFEMPLPRSTDQQKGSDKMKTRSGQETPGKTLPSSGSPNIGTIDKPDKNDKVKQLKLVQELDGAVGVASPSPQPSPQPATVEISIRALLEKMDKKLEDRFQRLESKLASKFDSLQEDVRTVREEVADSKIKFKELNTKVSDIIKSVEFSSKTCEEKDKKQTAALREMKEELECKVKALENKLLLQEKHDRK